MFCYFIHFFSTSSFMFVTFDPFIIIIYCNVSFAPWFCFYFFQYLCYVFETVNDLCTVYIEYSQRNTAKRDTQNNIRINCFCHGNASTSQAKLSPTSTDDVTAMDKAMSAAVPFWGVHTHWAHYDPFHCEGCWIYMTTIRFAMKTEHF